MKHRHSLSFSESVKVSHFGFIFFFSELVTGIKFTNDCKHLISVSGDGCIFLWALPWGLTHNMKERLAEMGQAKRREEQQYNMVRRGTYVVPPNLPLAVRSQLNAATTRNNNNNTAGEEPDEEEKEEVDFGAVDATKVAEQLQLHALGTQNKRGGFICILIKECRI